MKGELSFVDGNISALEIRIINSASRIDMGPTELSHNLSKSIYHQFESKLSSMSSMSKELLEKSEDQEGKIPRVVWVAIFMTPFIAMCAHFHMMIYREVCSMMKFEEWKSFFFL